MNEAGSTSGSPFGPEAQWIGLARGWDPASKEEHRTLPARYLRHEFVLPAAWNRATAQVCGLGMYDFTLNGRAPDDRIFAPGYTYFSKRALYVSYDVGGLIEPGANAIGVVLGSGRFFAPRVASPTRFTDFGFPRLLFQLDLELVDGTSLRIVSGTDWRATDEGPVRANNEYDGETYDARREMAGWDRPGFDAARWERPDILEAPTRRLDCHDYPPDRVTRELRPVSIHPAPESGWIVDFGENFYGNVRCRVRGPAGARASWTAAYSLDRDGALRTRDNRDARSTDTYILKGDGEESWSPRFRGQGMRKIHVTEWPGEPAAEDFTGRGIHADFKVTGGFSCSNPLINRLAENIRRGQRMYRRHGVPLDPDRNERQGWLGDIGANTASDLYNWDAAGFFRKWLVDIQLDQKPDGQLPDISPAIWRFYSRNVDWPAAYLIVLWNLWRFTGDRDTLEHHFPNLRKWIGFIQRELVLEDGTVTENIYTDWCDASTIGKTEHKSTATSGPFISSAYWTHCVRTTGRIARILGRDAEAAELEHRAEEARAGFLARFVEPVTGATPNHSQCELAILLALDLAPDALRARVATLLDDAVRKHADGHPTVGLVGMQWLMQGLLAGDCHDAAWALLTCRTRPSWGYMIEQGATTFWENWDTDTRDPGMNSEALLMLAGNLNSYLYEAIGGIRQAPDSVAFRKLVLAPVIPGDLSEAEAWHDSPQGRISSHWRIQDGRFLWNIEVPDGTTARLAPPAGCRSPVLVRDEGEETALPPEVGPGAYRIQATFR